MMYPHALGHFLLYLGQLCSVTISILFLAPFRQYGNKNENPRSGSFISAVRDRVGLPSRRPDRVPRTGTNPRQYALTGTALGNAFRYAVNRRTFIRAALRLALLYPRLALGFAIRLVVLHPTAIRRAVRAALR